MILSEYTEFNEKLNEINVKLETQQTVLDNIIEYLLYIKKELETKKSTLDEILSKIDDVIKEDEDDHMIIDFAPNVSLKQMEERIQHTPNIVSGGTPPAIGNYNFGQNILSNKQYNNSNM